MSKYDTPGICPFCGRARCLEWQSDRTEWRCRCCRACFAVRGYPPPPQVDPSPAERTDLIAKAYDGRLSCSEALLLAEYLVAHARQTAEQSKSCRKGVPFNLGYCLDHAIFTNTPTLEITP